MSDHSKQCVNPWDCAEFPQESGKTVIQVFQGTVAAHGDRPALCYKKTPEESYVSMSYGEYWQHCMQFAKALVKLEVPAFKIVNIIGFNSCEWFIANCGSILAGCISAGIYTTNNAEACRYITEHSQAE
eukprot:gene27333-33018_t